MKDKTIEVLEEIILYDNGKYYNTGYRTEEKRTKRHKALTQAISSHQAILSASAVLPEKKESGHDINCDCCHCDWIQGFNKLIDKIKPIFAKIIQENKELEAECVRLKTELNRITIKYCKGDNSNMVKGETT